MLFHPRLNFFPAFVLLISLMGFGLSKVPNSSAVKNSPLSAARQVLLKSNYGKLSLAFEPNQGQADPQVRFLARGAGYHLFLTPAEAVLALEKSRREPEGFLKPRAPFSPLSSSPPAIVRMRLVGGNRKCRFEGFGETGGKTNYLIGADPDHWQTNIPQYHQVRIKEVYAGIDLVYYGREGKLEYDFVVKPGADPGSIRLRFTGGGKTEIDGQGDLILGTGDGRVMFRAPALYQEGPEGKRPLKGRFLKAGPNDVCFKVEAYDRSRPLVIDPVLVYSTYLGGSQGDAAYGLAVDFAENAYVCGEAGSTFPATAGAYQTVFAGGQEDAFVAKLNSTGTALVYCTYLGGSGLDYALAIAIDAGGNAYVTGNTRSPNFPTTAGAYQTVSTGTTLGNAFVSKVNPAGNGLVYSTLLAGNGGPGGHEGDKGNAIAVDSTGNCYVTGVTDSTNFPTTAGAYQTSPGDVMGNGDVFVTKLNSTGTGLVYSTYIGGIAGEEAYGLWLGPSGVVFLTGSVSSGNYPITAGAYQTTVGGTFNCFITLLNAAGNGLIYSTYIGGNGWDTASALTVDSAGNIYIDGGTTSTNFPTTAGAYQTAYGTGTLGDAFVSELRPGGGGSSDLVYSTYLGGAGSDSAGGIQVDSSGDIFVAGGTGGNFPITGGAYQTAFGGGTSDAFLACLRPAGTGLADLLYSTYIGGTGADSGGPIVLDSTGIYLAGSAGANFPTTAGAYQTAFGGGGTDAFVMKLALGTITPGNTPTITNTPTPTPTITPPAPTNTPTNSPTPSWTPTVTFTPTITLTPTITQTFTPTMTFTPVCVTHLWPDPFNPRYAQFGTLKVDCLPPLATVSFYTLSGELVNQVTEVGGMVQWNGSNPQGLPASPGIYYYVIQSGSNVLSKGKFLISR